MPATLTDLEEDLEYKLKTHFVDLRLLSSPQFTGRLSDLCHELMPQNRDDLASVLASAPCIGYFEGDGVMAYDVYAVIKHCIHQQLTSHGIDYFVKLERDFQDEIDSLTEDGYEVRPYQNHFNIYLNNEPYHEGMSSVTEAWWWLQQGNNAK